MFGKKDKDEEKDDTDASDKKKSGIRSLFGKKEDESKDASDNDKKDAGDDDKDDDAEEQKDDPKENQKESNEDPEQEVKD